MSVPPEQGGEAGATLVELLVALALMALIALFIAGGVAASRGMAPVLRLADAGEAVAAVREHLRRTVSEAVTTSLLRQTARLRGSADAIEFVAPADPLLEGGGLVRVRIAAEAGTGGALRLAEWRALDRGDWSEAASRTALIDGVAALRFSYLGPDGPLPAWTDPDRAPRAVEISLDFAPDGGRRWPPLVIALPGSAAP